MKLMQYLLPLAMATCGFVATVNAADFSTVQEARERSPDAVLDYLKSKRAVTLAEKGGNLGISGDIQVDWEFMHARRWGDTHLRGGRSSKRHSYNKPKGTPYASNEFDVEVNLVFDYRADRTWAAIQFQFDNTMGIKEVHVDESVPVTGKRRNKLFGSGVYDDIVMRKAYMGYNVLDHGTSRLDVELGRRRLYDVFDSEVQFYNFFDGVLIKYANSFEGITDLTVKLAGFVVDQVVNHYGWVTEVGLLNIADTGFDFKYSFIDWYRPGHNRYDKKGPEGAKFQVNQWLVAYTLPADWLRWRTNIYGAFLYNGDAHRTYFTHNEKKDKAWYAGFKVGDVRRKGDWAFDARYEWVQAQAIPESDVSGAKRDNPQNLSFYDHTWGGFANYRSYVLDGFYALTDNWTLNVSYEQTREQSHHVGGKHRSYQFEVAAIYAF